MTDAAGHQGTVNTGIASVPDPGFSVAISLCNKTTAPANTVCFGNSGGLIDFTKITHVSLLYMYPRNYDPGHVTTVVLDAVRTTPSGGAQPAPPAPSVTLPGGLLVTAPLGTPVVFQVTFSAWGVLTPVPLAAGAIVSLGTAPGPRNLVVSGGPSVYTVTVSGMTGDGTVGIRIPAGIGSDNWGQLNVASSNEDVATVTLVVPPSFAHPTATTNFVAGRSNTYQVSAAGTPAPTIGETGILPSGVSFNTTTHILSGAPAAGTGGNYALPSRPPTAWVRAT